MDMLTELEQEGSLTDNPKPRLTLRDAVRLCGMSEKTLRRKLEAGLLHGYRENLDYGGFMWMIDARSLADLYPDSAQLRDYIRLLEIQLNQNPRPTDPAAASKTSDSEPAPPVKSAPLSTPEDKSATPSAPEIQEQTTTPRGKNDFVIYLLEENRCLKEDVREKEIRLRQLQDRTMMLERECGEQRGTASTQARVLEWFQQQPQPALPAPSSSLSPQTEEAEAPADTPPPPAVRPALLGALAATLLTWFLLGFIHMVSH